MAEEKDHIGFDPIKWIERLRDVNQGSQFNSFDRPVIEAALLDLQAKLEASRAR